MRYRRLRCPGVILFHDGFVHNIRDTSRQHSLPRQAQRVRTGLLTRARPAGRPRPARPPWPPNSAPSEPWHRTASLYAWKLHEQARGMRWRGAKDHVAERCGTRRSHVIVRVADRRGHSRRRRDCTRPAPRTSPRPGDIIRSGSCSNPEPAERYAYDLSGHLSVKVDGYSPREYRVDPGKSTPIDVEVADADLTQVGHAWSWVCVERTFRPNECSDHPCRHLPRPRMAASSAR